MASVRSELARMALRAIPALLLILAAAAASAASASRLSRSRAVVGEDGGYSGVTVRISDDVPEADCADIIQNLKVGRKALRFAYGFHCAGFALTNSLRNFMGLQRINFAVYQHN